MAERKQRKKAGRASGSATSRSVARGNASGGRGASRKAAKRNGLLSGIRWSLLFKGVVVSALLIVGVLEVDWRAITDRVNFHVNKPVASISVKGEFSQLSQSELQQLVVSQLEGNFMQVNIEALRASLHENPWVQSVSVQRVWPDGLLIEVREQKPIARWNTEGFINNEGDVITIGDNSHLSSLPLLAGPVEQSGLITRTYLDMTEIMVSYSCPTFCLRPRYLTPVPPSV